MLKGTPDHPHRIDPRGCRATHAAVGDRHWAWNATAGIDRAFEPFFTTKDVGHGTGLGLSQIHGFAARQPDRGEIKSREGPVRPLVYSCPQLRYQKRHSQANALPHVTYQLESTLG